MGGLDMPDRAGGGRGGHGRCAGGDGRGEQGGVKTRLGRMGSFQVLGAEFCRADGSPHSPEHGDRAPGVQPDSGRDLLAGRETCSPGESVPAPAQPGKGPARLIRYADEAARRHSLVKKQPSLVLQVAYPGQDGAARRSAGAASTGR
jgi:hypothetical protein